MSVIGFIGLGIMGRPMAGNLIAGGHVVHLFSRSGVPEDLAAAGGITMATAAAVAEACDLIITMLPDTSDVEEVLFGADGVAAGLGGGELVIDMSSIAPEATRDFAKRIQALGCEYLDAPVSGGELGAREGSLTIMVGGTQEAFDRARPVFELLGHTVTLVGGNGDGQIAKICNQIIVALTIEAVGEALVFASRAGADPARVREALLGGFAASRILEVHGTRMIERSFEPGFRIELHRKDLALALSAAQAMGMSLPATAMVDELFASCVERGEGGSDHSALVRAIERLAGHAIAG